MRELQAKEMDLKNASIVEFNLRQEIEQMGTQRLDLEEQLQDFQSNICQMQIQLKQRDMERDGLRREAHSLRDQLQMVQTAHDDILDEVSLLKEEVSTLQLQRIKLQATIERQDREINSLRSKVTAQQAELANSHKEQQPRRTTGH